MLRAFRELAIDNQHRLRENIKGVGARSLHLSEGRSEVSGSLNTDDRAS
jgi:hypothetical protein